MQRIATTIDEPDKPVSISCRCNEKVWKDYLGICIPYGSQLFHNLNAFKANKRSVACRLDPATRLPAT